MIQFRFFLTSILLICFVPILAQKQDTSKPKTDSAKTSDAKDKKKEKIKPYEQVITAKALTDDGIFKVHKVEDKYYFEIPDKVLKKDFLLVSRLSKAGAEMRSGFVGYAGDQIAQNVISFEKGPNDKVFIRSISFVDYAKDSTSQMYNSVTRNNLQSIEASFDIKAYGKDKKSTVIDVTDFISADSELVSFEANTKKYFNVGKFDKDKSYINFIKSFPNNIEINTTKTFARTFGNKKFPPGVDKPEISGNYTVEINSSLVLLPENKMQARYFDPRVGYFTVGYTDFDENPQGVKNLKLIKRWRLEPKPEDLEKYKRGELVEPAKPILFYIDPATPKKWVPFLIAGVNDWQKAFEKAGFKNAISARLPNAKDDPEWSLEDARFSGIVYKPSDVPNASGPSIADPRTGEILESHINWYHNVMNLLRNWYFVQASPNDDRARKLNFDDALMGELIRFVSSHEVGHTLGLRHNFGSSSTVPVEKLRDNKWLAQNGHTPSIMDYARFNYVAQPEDRISLENLMPRIGDYDEWAINWGYRRFYEFNSAETEKAQLNQWVISSLENPRLWFGTESNAFDPRSQSEQVGDNAMLASDYGIKNLKIIINNLGEWTAKPNEDYTDLAEMYKQVTNQFSRYMGHVSKYIGGEMETPKTIEQKGVVYEAVAKRDQKDALAFLEKNIFETPNWLINKEIYEKTGDSPIEILEGIQNRVFSRILSTAVLKKMYQSQSVDSKSYHLVDYLSDLKSSIFKNNKPDLYQRNLQRNFVESLIKVNASNDFASDQSDISAVLRGTLNDIKNERKAGANLSDKIQQYHNEDLVYRIEKALNPKN